MSTDMILLQAINKQCCTNIPDIKDTFIADTSYNLNGISNNMQFPLRRK